MGPAPKQIIAMNWCPYNLYGLVRACRGPVHAEVDYAWFSGIYLLRGGRLALGGAPTILWAGAEGGRYMALSILAGPYPA
jgi:hypothetical protein